MKCGHAARQVLFLSTIFSALCGAGAQATPAEEASIRQAYARVSFAVEMGSLLLNTPPPASRAAQNREALANGKVVFTVANIQGGPIAEILHASLQSVMTVPTGQTLEIRPTAVTYTEQDLVPPSVKTQTVATAAWTEPGTERPTEAFSMSVSEFISRSTLGNLPRYAVADVTAAFQGVSKTYKAFFLFRSEDDFESYDLLTNGSGLFETAPIYPHVVLETRRRFEPAIQAWVASHQVDGCASGANSVCCDAKTMTCGISKEDAATSLAAMPDSVRQPTVVPSPAS